MQLLEGEEGEGVVGHGGQGFPGDLRALVLVGRWGGLLQRLFLDDCLTHLYPLQERLGNRQDLLAGDRQIDEEHIGLVRKRIDLRELGPHNLIIVPPHPQKVVFCLKPILHPNGLIINRFEILPPLKNTFHTVYRQYPIML